MSSELHDDAATKMGILAETLAQLGVPIIRTQEEGVMMIEVQATPSMHLGNSAIST